MGQRGRCTARLGDDRAAPLNFVNLCQDRIERSGQTLVHHGRDVAFHEVRFIAIAADQVGQFAAADAREHGRIGDLESIEMKDRKKPRHHARD